MGIRGYRISLDQKHFAGLSKEGDYEPFETEVVKQEIKRGDTALDVGANIGYYTLIFARLVGKEGKVFAFEPEPNNFALLEKNVRRKGYQNVTLIQKAVSNETEKAKLYLCMHNVGDHRIYDLREGRKYIEIETVRLDDYFEEYSENIDFIKMDIQGAEGMALQGMSNLLRKNKNVKIIMEFSPNALKKSGFKPEKHLKLLLEHGFKLYDINEHVKKITPANIAELLEIYPKKFKFTNLLCIRNK